MNVTEIGNRVFFANELKSVTVMPKIPPKIGTEVFAYNYYITQINVPASSLEAYKAAPGWSDYADKMVPVEFEYPTSGTIMNIDWKIQDGSLTLSKNPNDEDGRILFTKNIWKSAGVYDIKNVVIGDGITNVPAGMFSGTDIESVVIGEDVEVIETSAFKGCEKLYDVIIGGSVKTIEQAAFMDCTSLESIVIGDSVEVIYSYAFNGVPLKSLYLPSNAMIIDGPFYRSFDIREWYDTDGRWLIGNQIGGHLFEVDGSVAKAVTAGDDKEPVDDLATGFTDTARKYLKVMIFDLKYNLREWFTPLRNFQLF